jgi:hypothetical protein
MGGWQASAPGQRDQPRGPARGELLDPFPPGTSRADEAHVLRGEASRREKGPRLRPRDLALGVDVLAQGRAVGLQLGNRASAPAGAAWLGGE